MRKRTSTSIALDDKDRRILALAQRDGAMAQSQMAKKVGLSTAAVNERLKKLEAAGVLRRWTAIVDPVSVGATVTAFVEVFFEHPRFETGFIARVQRLDEVLECHHITGEFSLLLKLRTTTMESLQDLLLSELSSQDGVRQTRTVMALSTVKEETYVDPTQRGERS